METKSSDLFRKHFGDTCVVGLKHPNIEAFFEELNEECKREDALKSLKERQSHENEIF